MTNNNKNSNTIVINIPEVSEAKTKSNRKQQRIKQNDAKQRFPISGSGGGSGINTSGRGVSTSTLEGEILREQLGNLRDKNTLPLLKNDYESILNNRMIEQDAKNMEMYNRLYQGASNAFNYLNNKMDRNDNFDAIASQGSNSFIRRGNLRTFNDDKSTIVPFPSIRQTPNYLVDASGQFSVNDLRNFNGGYFSDQILTDEDYGDEKSIQQQKKPISQRANDAINYFAEDVDEYSFSDEDNSEIANAGKAIIEATLPSSLNQIAQDVVNNTFNTKTRTQKNKFEADFKVLYRQLFNKDINEIRNNDIDDVKDILIENYGFEEN